MRKRQRHNSIRGYHQYKTEVRRGIDDKLYINNAPGYFTASGPAQSWLQNWGDLDNPNGPSNLTALNLSSGNSNYGMPLQPYRVYEEWNQEITTYKSQRAISNRSYEITDHLGNVRAVASNTRTWDDADNNGISDYTERIVTVEAWSDLFAGGMIMPGRSYASESYRYGMNGMEKDDEIHGNGNSYTTPFRLFDARIIKWITVDPLVAKFPHMSPYVAFDNNPVYYTDPMGLAAGGPGDGKKSLAEAASSAAGTVGGAKVGGAEAIASYEYVEDENVISLTSYHPKFGDFTLKSPLNGELIDQLIATGKHYGSKMSKSGLREISDGAGKKAQKAFIESRLRLCFSFSIDYTQISAWMTQKGELAISPQGMAEEYGGGKIVSIYESEMVARGLGPLRVAASSLMLNLSLAAMFYVGEMNAKEMYKGQFDFNYKSATTSKASMERYMSGEWKAGHQLPYLFVYSSEMLDDTKHYEVVPTIHFFQTSKKAEKYLGFKPKYVYWIPLNLFVGQGINPDNKQMFKYE